jgi:pentatricopeptide repeat protein
MHKQMQKQYKQYKNYTKTTHKKQTCLTCLYVVLFLAESMFTSTLAKFNLKADVSIYTNLLRMYSNAHRLDEALNVLERMKADSLTPTVEVYRILLILCRRERAEQAGIRILQEARANGIEPSEFNARLFDPILYKQHLLREKQKFVPTSGTVFTRDRAFLGTSKHSRGEGRQGHTSRQEKVPIKIWKNKQKKLDRERGRKISDTEEAFQYN